MRYLKLKITDIKTTVVASHMEGHSENPYVGRENRPSNPRQLIIVQVYTDEGIIGIGIHAHSSPASLFEATLETVIKPLVIGEDPFYVERIWDKMYRSTYRYGRKGVVIGVISSIDIALWDIIGKSLNTPLYKLLGAYRDKVPVYASGGYYRLHNDVESLADQISGWVKEGYTTVKFKLGQNDVNSDIARVKAVREAIGPDVKLMVDALGRWNTPYNAIKITKQLEKYDLCWLEEPVPSENHEARAMVRRAFPTIPIATGEEQATRYGFLEMISANSVDIVMPDACVCGGVSELRKIANLAAAHDLLVAPHRSTEVNVHLAASIPNLFMTESFPMNTPVYWDVWKDKYEIKNGLITVPNRPGLGIELDEKAVEKYKID